MYQIIYVTGTLQKDLHMSGKRQCFHQFMVDPSVNIIQFQSSVITQ